MLGLDSEFLVQVLKYTIILAGESPKVAAARSIISNLSSPWKHSRNNVLKHAQTTLS